MGKEGGSEKFLSKKYSIFMIITIFVSETVSLNYIM